MASPTLSRHAVSAGLGSSFRLPFLTVCLLAFLCFVWLATQANGGHSPSFDSAIRTAVHGQASPLGTDFMLYATQLGAVVALSFLSAAVILGFLFLRLKRAAALMAANMVGAGLLNDGLKAFFHRLRPDPFFGIAPPGDFSFPSGHSLCSFCFYGMIAALFVRRIRNGAARVAVTTAAVMIILLVGLSRVYLGVHYPTDVLGAWTLGLFWISFLLMFDKREEPRVPDTADVEAESLAAQASVPEG
jgi:undecaprenyl-diphosphatase